jgi:hypothetical protein
LIKEETMTIYLFDKVAQFKEKFKSFFIHKKKLQALENYSECSTSFKHKSYLPLMKKCLNDGFLGDKESDFLVYMIERYEVNFLDWCHRTPWLKRKMNNMKKETKAAKEQQLTFFNYPQREIRSSPFVPLELLMTQNNQPVRRI